MENYLKYVRELLDIANILYTIIFKQTILKAVCIRSMHLENLINLEFVYWL